MGMGKMTVGAYRSGYKKKNKRRYRKGYKSSAFSKCPRLLKDGFPSDKVSTTFVYSTAGTVSLGATEYAYAQIACNDIFDPEYGTWSAHITGERNAQPRYRDQIMGILYDTYRVVGSTIEVTFQNLGADETNIVKCWAYQVPNSAVGDTNITNIALVDEHPYMGRGNGKSFMLGALRGGKSSRKLTLSWSEKEFNTKDRMENEIETGNSPEAGLDPYWQIGLVTHDGTVANTAIELYIKVKYHCILSDPHYVNIS